MPRAGAVPSEVISLAYGMPDPALFPAAGPPRPPRKALRDPGRYAVALQYGNVGGNPLLLAELGRKLEAEEGAQEPGSLVMTNGSSQAISLVVQALANPGDVCLCEARRSSGPFTTSGSRGCGQCPCRSTTRGSTWRRWSARSNASRPPGLRRGSSTRSPRSTIPAG